MYIELSFLSAGVAAGLVLLHHLRKSMQTMHSCLSLGAPGCESSCACGPDCTCTGKSLKADGICACGPECACTSSALQTGSKCAQGGSCACGANCACTDASLEAGKPCACGPDCDCGPDCGCKVKTKRDVKSFVNDGINTIVDLRQALQCAIEMEFSTIPPYLCAEWSIKDNEHIASSILHEIVVQEMFHVSLNCNMLAAIGGKPSLTHANFIPVYPCQGLPGGVHPELQVDLLPLSPAALKMFMEIEHPSAAPVALSKLKYPTISAFYAKIKDAFQRLKPQFVATKQLSLKTAVGEAFAINSLADAERAIELICEQGEGSSQSPLPPPDFFSGEPAHYYAFKQLLVGHRLQKGIDGIWRYDGEEIKPAEVYSFQPAEEGASANLQEALRKLLATLESVWTDDPTNFRKSMHQMMHLAHAGTPLIQAGIKPEFHIKD